jgi:quinol monooxygenase YgiN
MTHGYAYVWEFEVAPEQHAAFERAYGPEGDWVRLFRQGKGYRRTELLRDRERPGRYLTVDYWESAEACAAFRAAFGAPFQALDEACAALTTREVERGRFETVGGGVN